jgi:hypothetical protein
MMDDLIAKLSRTNANAMSRVLCYQRPAGSDISGAIAVQLEQNSELVIGKFASLAGAVHTCPFGFRHRYDHCCVLNREDCKGP